MTDSSAERYVIIANAEPYQDLRKDDKIVREVVAGGLTTGLIPLMRPKDLWIAYGRGDADFEPEVIGEDNKLKVPDEEGFTLKRIPLSSEEVDKFYLGFSNQVLWPVCHNYQGKALYREDFADAYRKINRKYAEATLPELRSGDMVLIQDYHLALLPRMIKDEREDIKIGMFWHIPWPPWESFGELPWADEIAEGLSGNDFLGFHTERYVDNFLYCLKQMAKDQKIDSKIGASHKNQIFEVNNYQTKVGAVPLGVDFDFWNSEADEEAMERMKSEIFDGETEELIGMVTRLDYTKGIEEAINIFYQFLKAHPGRVGKIKYGQKISKSRLKIPEYAKEFKGINESISKINGEFISNPIWHTTKYLEQEEMKALYKLMDTCLVTSHRDGMNLTVKESIASNKKVVPILSKFAGATDQLGEYAILINPHDIREGAEAIEEWLEMDSEEKDRRSKALREIVREKDAEWWGNKLIRSTNEAFYTFR